MFHNDTVPLVAANGKVLAGEHVEGVSETPASDTMPYDTETRGENFHLVKKDGRQAVSDDNNARQWRDMSRLEQCRYASVRVIKPTCLLTALYFFICSLGMLSDAFQLLGGKEAGEALGKSELFNNPLAGLMIGVLATVLVQSSSTTTSIIVALTASNVIPQVKQAIPMIMGANIGTSVTNTIVSMGQAGNREDFRRAFAGATVHDMFNILAVLVLLPLEVASGYLLYLTEAIVNTMSLEEGRGDQDFLKAITEPFISLFVKLNNSALIDIAKGNTSDNSPLLLQHCGLLTPGNCSDDTASVFCVKPVFKKCDYAFYDSSLSESEIGTILLVISLATLISALYVMVKLLQSVLGGRMAKLVKKTANADLPGRWKVLTPYVAMLIGAGVTILVQSSSVFTSTLTPLVGLDLLTLERMFPLTLGSNVGTTVTGILAALASRGQAEERRHAFQVAFAHLFFNLSGILLWYPVLFMRSIPLACARFMGKTTSRYRWFALFYIINVFFLIPTTIFGLSLAGWPVLVAVLIPVVLLLIFVFIVNLLQQRAPRYLPQKLRTWLWLPLPLQSLKPYDNALSSCKRACYCRERTGHTELVGEDE